VQDVHGIFAVFACGVDVSARCRAGAWVTSSLARWPEILCKVMMGQTPRLLMFVHRPQAGVLSEQQRVGAAIAQNSSSSRTGFCRVLLVGPETRSTLARPRRASWLLLGCFLAASWLLPGFFFPARPAPRRFLLGGLCPRQVI
jgi:hypothetical protein